MSEPLSDRLALAAMFAAAGCGEDAPRLADATAWGLQLVPPSPDAPAALSRLGGPPLLPPGSSWPRDRRGRPLSFLAAIHLAELGDFDERDALPTEGWMIAFADIDNANAEGLVAESGNGDGDLARLFITPDAEPADAPDDLLRDANNILRERRVIARRTLVLPDDYEAVDRLEVDEDRYDSALTVLDDLHRRRLGAPPEFEARGPEVGSAGPWRGPEDTPRTDEALVAKRWRHPDDGRSLAGVHWIGGPATGTQGDPPGDTVLLLGLSWDEALGLLFLDGGTIQFRIPRDAAQRRDWSQVRALADSC